MIQYKEVLLEDKVTRVEVMVVVCNHCGNEFIVDQSIETNDERRMTGTRTPGESFMTLCTHGNDWTEEEHFCDRVCLRKCYNWVPIVKRIK